MNQLKAKLASWLKLRFFRPPVITEQSTLEEIASHYSSVWSVLEKEVPSSQNKTKPYLAPFHALQKI
ncbi:MAG: hypothetical protein EBQ92_07655 [Proteobacteria bacterium]|nr:hypothetical protein [Pseudomonadota bacterium]